MEADFINLELIRGSTDVCKLNARILNMVTLTTYLQKRCDTSITLNAFVTSRVNYHNDTKLPNIRVINTQASRVRSSIDSQLSDGEHLLQLSILIVNYRLTNFRFAMSRT